MTLGAFLFAWAVTGFMLLMFMHAATKGPFR